MDDIRLVSEAQVLGAIQHLLVKENIVAEPAGAAVTAAWLGDSTFEGNGPVVLVVTGANMSEPIRDKL